MPWEAAAARFARPSLMSFDRQRREKRTFELWWITNEGFERKVGERKNAGVCMRQAERPKLRSTFGERSPPRALPLSDGYELDRIQWHSIQIGTACNSPIYICIHKTSGAHSDPGPSLFCFLFFVDVMRNSAHDEAPNTKGLFRRIATPDNVLRQK